MRFSVRAEVVLSVSLDAEPDLDVNVARDCAELLANQFIGELHKTNIKQLGTVRLTDYEVKYPEHINERSKG